MRKALYFILFLFLVACVPVNHLAWVRYTVPAGENISIPRAQIPLVSAASFSFKTNNTWRWEKPEPSGFSKIAGIFWFKSHYTSARLVFDGEKLGYYFYVNGVSPMQNPKQMGRLIPVKIPHIYYCKTGWENDSLFIHLSDGNGYDTTVRYPSKQPIYPASFDQPWVGGQYTIDHNWIVPIKLN